MESEDLVNRFLAKLEQIGCINMTKMARSYGCSDLSLFRGIGTCELKRMRDVKDADQISECYLVWYKPNKDGLSGWNVNGSVNYRLGEYLELIQKPEVSSLIESFRKGLKSDVEILVAFDTTLNLGLIVDGTKRALALHYLKDSDGDTLNRLLTSDHSIDILQLNSAYCKVLFPCDFLKLCLKNA
jgi:hypothetical protein